MNQYIIRINKSRGQPGRGTTNHIWRVFENGNEFLFKNLVVNSKLTDYTDGMDYSMLCNGIMDINRDNSTCTINNNVENIQPSKDGQKYLIRYNKFRGQEGFGSKDHVWILFEGEKEYYVKHLRINVPSLGEVLNDDRSKNDNFNISCFGSITIDADTAIIK